MYEGKLLLRPRRLLFDSHGINRTGKSETGGGEGVEETLRKDPSDLRAKFGGDKGKNVSE